LKTIIKKRKLWFGIGLTLLAAKKSFLVLFGGMFLEDTLAMTLGSTGITVGKVLLMMGVSLILWWLIERFRK